jgi:hypothetical protein
MQLFTAVFVLSLSSAFPLAFGHSGSVRLPPLRFFGGEAVVKELRAAGRNREVINQKRWFPDPDVNKHKQCGPGIGSCDAGDWWVLSLSIVYHGYVTFIVVAHPAVIAVEGFTTARVLSARSLSATAAIHTRDPSGEPLSISRGH